MQGSWASGNNLSFILSVLPASPPARFNCSVVLSRGAPQEPGGSREVSLRTHKPVVLWALSSACNRNYPFAHRYSSGCAPLIPVVRVASSPSEARSVEKRAAGRVDGYCLNRLNTVVSRETGIVSVRA